MSKMPDHNIPYQNFQGFSQKSRTFWRKNLKFDISKFPVKKFQSSQPKIPGITSSFNMIVSKKNSLVYVLCVTDIIICNCVNSMVNSIVVHSILYNCSISCCKAVLGHRGHFVIANGLFRHDANRVWHV